MPATELAATPLTLSIYQGYGLPDREVVTTLGAALGEDHIAWICEQPNPTDTASARSRGMWDANMLDMATAYTKLSTLLAA